MLMKTTIYLVRHGESEANAEGILYGQTDCPLSVRGISQAEKTGEYLRDRQIDALYCSDLQRARVTAVAIGLFHPDLRVRTNIALREINCGEWEGKTVDWIRENYPEEYRVWRENIGRSVRPGGESVAQMQKRIVRRIKHIVKKHEGQTVCIVIHAMAIRAFWAFAEGKTLDEMKDVPWVSNASVTTLTCEDGKFTLEELGYDGHLGDRVTTLKL